jgi:hypothetical protein
MAETYTLSQRLERRTNQLERLSGVEASLLVIHDSPPDNAVVTHNLERPYFAASLAKLDIALAVQHSNLSPQDVVSLQAVAQEGGGHYDNWISQSLGRA